MPSQDGGSDGLRAIARRAVELATKKGAGEVAAVIDRSREVQVAWRDGKLERIQDATTRQLGLRLYVDGRYSSVSTSDLREGAVARFLDDAIAMTRTLARDPFRTLPDPALYRGQAEVDLKVCDPGYAAVDATRRRELAQAIEAAAHEAEGRESILSVTAHVSDGESESVRVHSNGFEGAQRETSYFMGADVSMKDADGRRPEDGQYAGARHLHELPDAVAIGKESTARARGRLGAKKTASAEVKVLVENRAARRLWSFLVAPLSAGALQQRRSFLEGKTGVAVGSAALHVTDDPLLPKGFGSRLYDGEGIAARKLPIFERGVLSNYYVDVYYGKKLKLAPTTAGPSNLSWQAGARSLAELRADMHDGLFVTGFLGGNSNATTGDFSLGIQGFCVRGRKLSEPFAEMNLSGNHLELWKRLLAVGNDPYPYSASRTPSLLFDRVQVAGT
jgi:PmbA protein